MYNYEFPEIIQWSNELIWHYEALAHSYLMRFCFRSQATKNIGNGWEMGQGEEHSGTAKRT